jgi:C-terminal processing protease CtpA/Prc
LPFEGLPRFRLFTDGIRTPFRSGVVALSDSGPTIGIVRIPSFEENADIGLCLAMWSKDEVWDSQGNLLRARLRQLVEGAWYAALADILKRFKNEGAIAVMVDVGHNSGGDDSGDIAGRLFTATELRSAPLWLSHDSSAATPYLQEQLAALRGWPLIARPLWGAWTGPMYVLTDDRTYSAAEMFVAVLKNNGAARTIGQRTGGDGCGFMGTPPPVELPHSRMRFRLPNCVRIRADGTDEVAGVNADIPATPIDGENARARAMRVLVRLIADLKPR